MTPPFPYLSIPYYHCPVTKRTAHGVHCHSSACSFLFLLLSPPFFRRSDEFRSATTCLVTRSIGISPLPPPFAHNTRLRTGRIHGKFVGLSWALEGVRNDSSSESRLSLAKMSAGLGAGDDVVQQLRHIVHVPTSFPHIFASSCNVEDMRWTLGGGRPWFSSVL